MADKTMKEDFNGFVFDRAFSTGYDEIKSDPQYCKYSEKYNKTFKKIKKLLGDNQKLIFTLEETENAMGTVFIRYAYMRGFKDGLQFKNMLGLDK